MKEPDMREHCNAFQKAQITKPDLVECPEEEIQVLRPLSGHGGKVCEFCRTKNRNSQRERENAQKRARRAKLKREKMTAGIGAGNVVWTAPPNFWTPSVMNTQTLALHSPQPCRDAFKVRSTTQAIQYGLSGGIGRATMAQNHVNISQNERGVCTQSSQELTTSMATVLPPREKGLDTVGAMVYDAISSSHQHGNDPQDHSTITTLPAPLHEAPKHEEVGLGITLPNAAKWSHSNTETCSFHEWSFRMELNRWSTLFDDDNYECGGVKEYEETWKLSECAGALLDARSLQPSTVFSAEEL